MVGGYDETHILSVAVVLDLRNDTLAILPRLGLIVEFVVPTCWLTVFLIAGFCHTTLFFNLFQKGYISRKTCKELHIMLAVSPVHEVVRAEMAVAAKHEYGAWPYRMKIFYHSEQNAVHIK